MYKYIIKKFFLSATFLFVPAALFFFFTAFFNNDFISFFIDQSLLTTSIKLRIISFAAMIYSLEYMPVILFLVLFFFGNTLHKNHIRTFCRLKGFDINFQLSLAVFLFCAGAALVFSYISNVTLPNHYPEFFNDNRAQIIENAIRFPEKLLQKKEFIHIDRFITYFDEVEKSNGNITLSRVKIFEKEKKTSQNPAIESIISCQKVILEKEKWIDLDDCHIQTFGFSMTTLYKKNIHLDMKELDSLIGDALKTPENITVDVIQYLPLSFQYYVYPGLQIIQDLYNKTCPVNTKPFLFRRIFYFLSFFTYCFLAFLYPYLQNASFTNRLLFLSTFTIVIPFAGDYMILFEKYSFNLFSITYFLPVLSAIVYLSYLFVKRKIYA